jgi:threonine dehydrogenase-like Zn-dependent dehydrogenase
MRAVVYHGPGRKSWDEVPDPEITGDDDVIVRVDATTICGTDLHILKGDVPAVRTGRILGHEAVGTITTGLVDTSSTPTLLQLVASGQIDAKRFITHHFGLDEFDEAYDVFSRAADTGALKVVLSR